MIWSEHLIQFGATMIECFVSSYVNDAQQEDKQSFNQKSLFDQSLMMALILP